VSIVKPTDSKSVVTTEVDEASGVAELPRKLNMEEVLLASAERSEIALLSTPLFVKLNADDELAGTTSEDPMSPPRKLNADGPLVPTGAPLELSAPMK